MRLRQWFVLASVILAGVCTPAQAQTPPPRSAVVAMVRSTLLAVDQANKTGNYTVLRDLAGPQFHDNNNAARLAQIFGTLPAQGVDLLPVAITEPVFSQEPSITPDRMLRVVGGFQMHPRAIAFEVVFEPVGGQWRIYSLAILPA